MRVVATGMRHCVLNSVSNFGTKLNRYVYRIVLNTIDITVDTIELTRKVRMSADGGAQAKVNTRQLKYKKITLKDLEFTEGDTVSHLVPVVHVLYHSHSHHRSRKVVVIVYLTTPSFCLHLTCVPS